MPSIKARPSVSFNLEPTALANEVWLRLLQSREAGTLDHGAFLGVASQAMRRILTDHARRKIASKRGAQARRTTLSDKFVTEQPQEFAVDMNEALSALESAAPELAQLVELRFYAACSTEEIAEALQISPRTVKRRWRFARAWLQHYMEENDR